ncbi:25011_t:CDS:2, partial [Cetraspora pellucida]
KEYALKSLDNNLGLDEKEFNQLQREELEKLSIEPVIEFITNDTNQTITQTELYPNEDDDLDEYNYCIEYHNDLVSISDQHRIIKPVELVNGNLVIECPVHSSLLINSPHENSEEFIHMRYTACTSKPDTFNQENFTLRQAVYEPMRQTELFILIAINDEDEIMLSNTLHKIVENIAYLCSLSESQTWGEDGWKKIIVCIISDRNKINKRTLSYLKTLGVYQDGIARSKVNNKTVRAHIYEYTTQISIKCSKDSVDKKTTISTQILFCLKEKNKGKTDYFIGDIVYMGNMYNLHDPSQTIWQQKETNRKQNNRELSLIINLLQL